MDEPCLTAEACATTRRGDRAIEGVNAVAAGTARDAPAAGDRDRPSVAQDRTGGRRGDDLGRWDASGGGDGAQEIADLYNLESSRINAVRLFEHKP